jgi:hypothetical protein
MANGQWFMPQHRDSLRSDGYAVFRGVIPRDLADRASREIAGFVGGDIDDPPTWYSDHLINRGVIPVHHAQILWDVRQHPNLYSVFSEIHDTHKLMVDINRCCFHPPRHPDWPGAGPGEIHWDIDPRAPTIGWLQGVVLLSDVEKNGGGFQCVPQIYRRLDDWLDVHARGDDFDFFNPGISFDEAIHIEGGAGDLIVWCTLLPHGPAPNLSHRPRIAQFVSMGRISTNATLMQRVANWCIEKRAPEIWRGWPFQQDPEPGPPVQLSALGRRLVGLDPWPDEPEAITALD